MTTDERIEIAVVCARRELATPENPMPEFEEAWEKARELEPDIFEVRPQEIKSASAEILEEILRRRLSCEPKPWDQLFEIASDILTREAGTIRRTGKAARQEAFQRACERYPDLFQEWQESIPAPSGLQD